MLRVLHIVGKMDRAGAETMLMNLYRNIDRKKVQFDFITFTLDEGDYDDEIISLGGKIYPITASNPIDRMFKIKNFLLKNREYKIVHAHMALSNGLHMLSAKMAGVKTRISHSHNTNSGKSGLLNYAYEKISLILNNYISTHKIACGKEAAKYLFGSNTNVMIINNSIDLELYKNIARKDKNYWNSIKKCNNGIKLLQVGRLIAVKNHYFSLEIARKLRQKEISFTFYIAGQGPLEDSIREKILEYNLVDCVILLGLRSDVPSLMASADIMLMPSLSEGFPVVLVESQAIGLMSIISNQVPFEVDIGLGLINFLSLEDVDTWVNEIISYKQDRSKNLVESNILRDRGFDVVYNAEILKNFYTNT
jgi:glycosyltransferase EpsF